MLTDKIRNEIRRSVLCWLATVDADGHPSVSPKQIFCASGEDKVLIADIASANSVRNMLGDPKVCVSFVDVFRQVGFKLYGQAEIVERDAPDFRMRAGVLLAMTSREFTVRRLIDVTISRAVPIIAPGYNLPTPWSEEDHIRQGHATYGVRPARW